MAVTTTDLYRFLLSVAAALLLAHLAGTGVYSQHHSQQSLLYSYLDRSAQCRLKGGTCMDIDSCDTTANIYKDICKTYFYNSVCCISRITLCHKLHGFCTNMSELCETAGKLVAHDYRVAVYSWLTCNATHRCCHPIDIKKKHSTPLVAAQSQGYGGGHSGGYGGGHGGGYGGGHGGGYGGGHGGGYGGGHQGGYGGGHGGGYGHVGGYGKSAGVGHSDNYGQNFFNAYGKKKK